MVGLYLCHAVARLCRDVQMKLALDEIAENAIIEISQIQRKAWECKEMARRLTTDAKIVLERAGYLCRAVTITRGNNVIRFYDDLSLPDLKINGGTVDNDEVVKLLNARGFDENGYRYHISADDMAEAEANDTP